MKNDQVEIEAVTTTAIAPVCQIADPTLQQIAPAFDRSSYVPDEHRRGPRIRRATNPSKVRGLATPRDKEPWVTLRAANVKALGPRGAIMFDYIAQWYEPKKNGAAHLRVKDCHGSFWHACSFTEIEERTGLEKYDAERGITACVDAGVLETTVMKFDGHRTLHIRITEANGAATLQGPLIVGPVGGPKLAGPFKNDSKVDGSTLVTDQSGPVNFPIQHQLPSTPTKTTPAADASLAAGQTQSNSPQEETKPNPASAEAVTKAKLSYFDDYVRGVKSVGGCTKPPMQDVLRNVKSAAARLKDSGQLTCAQVHEFFFLVGVHADYLQCSWKHLTSAKGYDGHGMPVDEDVLAYVVGSKVHGKNRLWTALDAIGHHLTKEQPASDTPKAKKPIKLASATPPTQVPVMADALASAPAVPAPEASPCASNPTLVQAATAPIPVVPVQLGFDLINPKVRKHQILEEAAAWDYLDLVHVDHSVEATA